MTVSVSAIAGPDGSAFLYLFGEVEGYPHVARTRTVALAALASGALTVAGEKAALVADVEQALVNWQAAQQALLDL